MWCLPVEWAWIFGCLSALAFLTLYVVAWRQSLRAIQAEREVDQLREQLTRLATRHSEREQPHPLRQEPNRCQ